MAARAIWEGTIGFGLVQIPVGLYSAESRDELNFDLLDKRDMSPVGYQRYNRETGEPVDWDDIVKGYAVKKGEYVILENEDFKRANVKATQTVDIVQFTDAEAIDPTYFEKPYYLVPGKRGAKPYVLLREALRKSGKVGIARVVIRTRESLAAVMVKDDALVLELLRYSHELHSLADYDLPTGKDAPKISAPELKMAERLIDEMTAEFKPEEFKDTYRDELLAFIKRKWKGEEVEEVDVEAEAPATNVVDMMALLKKSLQGGGKASAEAADKQKNKPKRTAARNPRPAKAKKASATNRKKTAKRAKTSRRKAA
ncbi:Ku protein [Nannocystis sp. ILAH1]|uniref:non-homologous end joining protein Ku n=1 Tax=unclassified Nannocystis TaxID=2627009 RepID=UPI00226F42EB|nr:MULTISPECIES: Ku protein [unclassified Nannocystis]MCY0991797.1 Ku protein [Nannocystis sp. ILAH1]MCY1067341.1 Ku protein [Nannocystis sp. RBIL2]